MKQTAKIFLCYAKEDKPQVEELYHKLQDAGFAPWMDKVDLVGGEEWRPTIQKAIREAHFFLACVSQRWIPTNPQDRKRFFPGEIQTALDVLPEFAQGDIFVIPIRLDECEVPDNLSLFHWIDYFQNDGWDRLLQSIYKGINCLGRKRPLRSKAIMLSHQEVTVMVCERGFYDLYINSVGKGIQHNYERHGKEVFDATTSLTWQQSGSPKALKYAAAEEYIRDLNKEKFAGYTNWRLPTLEEAMSLMEPKRIGSLYIDLVFDGRQCWIWTADKRNASLAWLVGFGEGYCQLRHLDVDDAHYVRAVR